MYRSYQTKFTPPSTPPFIKYLIGTLGAGLTLSALLNLFFLNSFMYPICAKWLGLSRPGMLSGFLWQLFTYPIISQQIGLSFSLIIQVLFNVYIIWMIGSMIVERVSTKSFGYFLALISLGTGIAVSIALVSTPTLFVLSGPSPILNSLLIAWAMFYGEGIILLFFVIPLRIRTLAFGYLALITLMNLSAQNYIEILADLTGPVLAYLFCVLFWELKAPFRPFHHFDNFLMNLKLRTKTKLWGEESSYQTGKRYDFRTGKPVTSDEDFIDAMLDKISKSGKSSLSLRERWKLYWISKKRRRS